MSRPIAYNASGPLSGSIRGANVNYIVDSGDRNFATFGGKKWVPSADGAAPIVFVTDTFTQGFQGDPSLAVPLFYSCNGTGSAAIIYTANRIPGSPGNYSDANVALNDLITARGYFILESNDPFQGIDADSLALSLDASKMSSYPQVSTSWKDISGQATNGTLINAPTFNSSLGTIFLDGVDDFVTCSLDITKAAIFNNQDITFEMLCNTTTNNDAYHTLMYVTDPNAGTGNNADITLGQWRNGLQNGSFYWQIGTSVQSYLIDSSATITSVDIASGKFFHVVGTWVFNGVGYQGSLYVNGNLLVSANSAISTYTAANATKIFLGNDIYNSFRQGNINNAKIYSKGLTPTEVKQNYFGAPIVTDGLVFAVDANNLVSYPKSGTSWYNLTGSITSGSLVSGPTFSPLNGGSIVFDGTDDAVITNLTQTFTNELTVETWYRGTKSTRNHLWNFYGSNLSCNFNDSGRTLWMYWEGGGSNAIRFTSPNFTDNNIHHLVFRHSGSTNQIYFDGQLLTPLETLGTQTFTGVGGSGYDIADSPFFGGNIYANRVYNKALSPSEILQNYQAEQYRFETPAGPVTNGLVLYWDAGNLDSYPGTGTTIYDLSGNGNNGSLVNGVGFNQINGGVLTFDGVDDYVNCSSPNLAATNNTVMGASRYNGSVRGRMINATSNNWLMGNWGTTTENYYAEGWVTTPGSGPSDTNWRIYSALGDISADIYSLYVNNSLSAGPSNGGSQGPNGITISNPGGEPSTGNFSFVLVYNRVLTVAEMTQNYNFFKGRFGL